MNVHPVLLILCCWLGVSPAVSILFGLTIAGPQRRTP